MHESKICMRCGAGFECKPGNITQCQCFGIKVSEKTQHYLEQHFGDCICAACLKEIGQQQDQYDQFNKTDFPEKHS